MRILIVNRHRAIAGGVETYLERLLHLLAKQGISIGLLYFDAAGTGAKTMDRETSIRTWQWKAGFSWESLEQWNPDVAFLHSVLPSGVHAALADRFPLIQYVHDYQGVCISGHKMHSAPSAVPCQQVFGPACLARYFPRRCGGRNPLVMIDLYRRQAAVLPQLRKNSHILVASEHMRSEYLRHGMAASQVTVLRLPATTDLVEAPAPSAPGGTIVFLGRLSEQKGAHYLIPAAELAQQKLSRPLTVLLCGSGPETGNLVRQAERSKIAVEMRGWVSAEDRLAILRGSSLLALPSVWPEPFGMAGLEAATQGVPAVAYDSGGVREWLRPGLSGELAPADPPTPEGLSDAIVRALGDAGHYQRLCRGAWDTAHQFLAEPHVEQLLAILAKASKN